MKDKSLTTVVVGMSGGVDSSVTALLLKQQGYKVIGLHMKGENKETAEVDEQIVRSLCNRLKIECVVKDYREQMQIVKDYFVNEYKKGRTPNPCVMCNRYVKFVPFIEFANEVGADYFATGHYARIAHENGKTTLFKAIDKDKDQSYFLNQLTHSQLEKALFPLGELTKTEVREIAEKYGLESAHKKDSFDVCFVGSLKFKEYIASLCKERAGDIIDIKTNQKVGEHQGLARYTIGQRRGLGVGGKKGFDCEGWFVVKKDLKNNILYVTNGDNSILLSNGLVSNKVNWLKAVDNEFACKAKFRYRQDDQEVLVKTIENGKTVVTFKTPQRAVTVGQYVVFYDNDICLGGGEIDEVIKNEET